MAYKKGVKPTKLEELHEKAGTGSLDTCETSELLTIH